MCTDLFLALASGGTNFDGYLSDTLAMKFPATIAGGLMMLADQDGSEMSMKKMFKSTPAAKQGIKKD
jgi:hypothetical protein